MCVAFASLSPSLDLLATSWRLFWKDVVGNISRGLLAGTNRKLRSQGLKILNSFRIQNPKSSQIEIKHSCAVTFLLLHIIDVRPNFGFRPFQKMAEGRKVEDTTRLSAVSTDDFLL